MDNRAVRPLDVLLVNGSPRRRGNTASLLAAMAKELAARGLSSRIVSLDAARLRPCRGCNWCQGGEERLCRQRDGMDALYRELLSCRALVVGSPVYWAGPSGQTKLFIDRLYALMKWRGGKFKSLISGKRAVIVLCAGGGKKEGLAAAAANLRTVLRWCGMKISAELLVPGVNRPGEAVRRKAVARQAAAAAKKTHKELG